MEGIVQTGTAAIAALILLAGPVTAGDSAFLAAGKPAGIKRAQDTGDMTALYVIGGGAVIAGIVILASDDDDTPTATATAATSS
jgi:hypothetical protein